MYEAKLPNLELLEYQAKQILAQDNLIKDRLIDYYSKQFGREVKKPPILLSCEMWLQTFGSTATAFDVDEQGCPTISGSAMTDAYVVVFEERITETYLVFVNNQICYKVDNPTEKFREDLQNRQIASLSRAKKIY